jgi:NAD(P)H dehydrogenase (quinone)
MHALIVYAHPEPKSFNGALKDIAIDAIGAAGHSVEVSDLYAEQFDPVGGRQDFSTVADPKRFHYQNEQLLAAQSGTFSEEIKREQARVRRAEFIMFQFPLWWGGPPAILKGWLERVLAHGFAFADGRRYDTGLFKGGGALICVTTGGTAERYSASGIYGDIGQVLWPMRRLALEYFGLEVEEPFVCYAAARVDPIVRASYLSNWRARVRDALDRDDGRAAAQFPTENDMK